MFFILSILLSVVIYCCFIGNKVATTTEYAISNKNHSTSLLSIYTITAVFGLVLLITDMNKIYEYGIIGWLGSLGIVIRTLITAKIIAPNFDERFASMVSLGDMMNYLYGKKISFIASVMSCVLGAITLYAVAHLLGLIISNTLGTSTALSYKISILLIMIISCWGGIVSLNKASVLCFIGIIIVIFSLVFSLSSNSNYSNNISLTLPSHYFQILSHKNFESYLLLFVIWVIPFSVVGPETIQRYLMARNREQLVSVNYFLALAWFVASMLVMHIAFVSHFSVPKEYWLLFSIINNILSPFFQIIVISSLLIIGLVRGGAILNSITVLCAFNIVQKYKNNLTATRIISIVLGIVMFCLADFDFVISELLLFISTIFAIFVGLPLLAGILWGENKKYIYIPSIAITLCVVLLCAPFVESIKILPLLAISTKIVVYVFWYLYCKFSSQWFAEVTIKTKQYLFHVWDHYYKNFKINAVLNAEENYVLVAIMLLFILCISNFIAPVLLWKEKAYAELVINMRYITVILSIGLLLKDLWPKKLKKYYIIYWYVLLLYSFPFATFVSLYLTSTPLLSTKALLSVFLLAAMVDWVSFFLIFIIGFAISYGFIWSFYPMHLSNVQTNSSLPVYYTIYMFSITIIFGLLLTRRKAVAVQEKLNIMRTFASSIAHEVKEPLAHMAMVTNTLKKLVSRNPCQETEESCVVKYNKRDYSMIQKKISEYDYYIQGGYNTIDLLLMSMHSGIASDKYVSMNLKEVVLGAVDKMPVSEFYKKRIHIKGFYDMNIYGPQKYITHTIHNIVVNAIKYALIKQDAVLVIYNKGNKVYFEDTGTGIPINKIDKIFDQFYTGGDCGTGLGLSFCKMVMEEIGGNISCYARNGGGVIFELEFVVTKL